MINDNEYYIQYHIPVLQKYAVGFLVTRYDGIYVDGTCGGGGHTQEILKRINKDARVIGIDQDEDAIRECKKVLSQDGRCTVVKDNFLNIQSVLRSLHIQRIDGVLLDLGISSWQIDAPHRGFSYRIEGQLDMRMNSETQVSAMHIVNVYSREDLIDIFKKYGEEKNSHKIADAIFHTRSKKRITTTTELAEIIRPVTPARFHNKTLSRIYQALRIAVNNELENLQNALSEMMNVLQYGGRIVVISYHSLEDRIVKDFFKQEFIGCICPPRIPVCTCGKVRRLKILTSKPITPSYDEVKQNPRARSAKLRAAEKIVP